MKTQSTFVFNPVQPEYIIKLKAFKFPWWILLIPLLFLFLLIKIDKEIEVKVLDKNTQQPISGANVVLTGLKTGVDEKLVITGTTDTAGLVIFKVGSRRLYHYITGGGQIVPETISLNAGKTPYKPDSLLNMVFATVENNEKNRTLHLEPEQKAEIPDEPQKPKEGCRAFFTGLVVGCEFEDQNISEVYKVDDYSEYVGAGSYPDNEIAFPKAVASTFDGIAIDKGTRVIIYSKKNFEGDVLLDKTGPAIINNIKWKGDERYDHCNTETYKEPLQSNFPQSVREWSKTDMQEWSFGSLKVICQ